MASRLEQLEQFVNEDPTDPFNIYALALEYQKSNADKSLTLFNRLVEEHKHYVPTYYHLGKLYQSQGEIEKAEEVFTKGMIVAREANDNKAFRELDAAKQELLEED